MWVVDDEPAIVGYLYEFLTTAGYLVRCFSEPNQVISAFKTDMDKIDLLVTDQTMPEMSGIELAKHIHTIKPSLPIILCSGNVSNYDPMDLKSESISCVFSKPLVIDSFLAAVSFQINKTI
ncbi:response regulator [Zwartia sp.]|uniref:response regulator n=1 Tax=Zwartia sp. TaxID=2978004 RepID=UPI003BAE3D41